MLVTTNKCPEAKAPTLIYGTLEESAGVDDTCSSQILKMRQVDTIPNDKFTILHSLDIYLL